MSLTDSSLVYESIWMKTGSARKVLMKLSKAELQKICPMV
jgi:hypothetical protein